MFNDCLRVLKFFIVYSKRSKTTDCNFGQSDVWNLIIYTQTHAKNEHGEIFSCFVFWRIKKNLGKKLEIEWRYFYLNEVMEIAKQHCLNCMHFLRYFLNAKARCMRLATSLLNKAGVINDPFGQTHIIFTWNLFCFERLWNVVDRRTNDLWKQLLLPLWVGRVDQKVLDWVIINCTLLYCSKFLLFAGDKSMKHPRNEKYWSTRPTHSHGR